MSRTDKWLEAKIVDVDDELMVQIEDGSLFEVDYGNAVGIVRGAVFPTPCIIDDRGCYNMVKEGDDVTDVLRIKR